MDPQQVQAAHEESSLNHCAHEQGTARMMGVEAYFSFFFSYNYKRAGLYHGVCFDILQYAKDLNVPPGERELILTTLGERFR